MPPANAAAISRVLSDISNFSPPLLTRPAQQSYLTDLTSTHKFTYYSSTYGHTIHDAASLRKVLANTMRHHPNPEFGVAGGNAAVDTLFQFGCEMLEPGYVEEVMRAALEEVVERREEEEEEDDEDGESDEEEGLAELLDAVGESERDEDFVPPAGRRLRRRKSLGLRKRKTTSADFSEGGSSEGWRESGTKKIKRKHAIRSASPTSPSGHLARQVPKKLEAWQRSHVGQYDATRHLQQDGGRGRDVVDAVMDRRQSFRGSSGLACDGQPRLQVQSTSDTDVGPGKTDHNAKLREAVERLNRRVHTAIVQLWDEIGGRE